MNQYPRICWDNLVGKEGVVVTGSTNAPGHPMANLHDWRDYTAWKSSDTGELFIKLSAAGMEADCIAIAGHNMVTAGVNGIVLESSDDDVIYTPCIDPIDPADDSIIFRSFQTRTADFFKLTIPAGYAAPPEIGVLFIGTAMIIPAFPQQGFDPDAIQHETTAEYGRTGRLLGIAEGYAKREMSLSFKRLEDSFITDTWVPFFKQHAELPFFFGWGPPDHAILVRFADAKIDAPFEGVFRELSFDLIGREVLMSYDDKRDALSRAITWRVLIELDQCANTFSQSPCFATGAVCCYYTYATCKDHANFSRATKQHAFSKTDGPKVPGALPYLVDIKTVPTEIKARDNVTRRARITLQFSDDRPHTMANPDKAVSNIETGGTYMRNLIARHPNLVGRPVEIQQGFSHVLLEEYRTIFRGIIDRVEYKEPRLTVVVKDRLKLLDKKVPPPQSAENVLTSAYNGGPTMSVTNGVEFEAPGTVKIDDEYIDFSEVSGNDLIGCEPARYGSAGAPHPKGSKVRQILALADPHTGEGMPPDEIFMRLICGHGGIDPLEIAAAESNAVLISAIDATGGLITVTDPTAFSETGVIRIGDELIMYNGIWGDDLIATQRGAFGTIASPHDTGDPVRPTCFSDQLGRWMSGTLYRRFVERRTPIKELVNELREQSLVHIWQGGDSKIHAKCVAPQFFTDTPAHVDDDTALVYGSVGWDPGLELRTSRVTVRYEPTIPDAGRDTANYNGTLVVIDAESESQAMYGSAAGREVWGGYIYREHEALLLATRWLIRYRDGASTLRFALELKDSVLDVGDFVRVTSRDVIRPDGSPSAGALFEVVKKRQVTDNRFEYVAVDTRLDKRYPVISPALMTGDYDDAGVDERDRYGWIGDAQNRVGGSGADGYYLY